MSRATSLNALTDTGITREIDSKYDVVKEVSLHLAAIDYLSLIDLEQVSSNVATAMDFTGITIVSGEVPNWDPITKILTIPTVKGDTGGVISVTSIVTNPDYTLTLVFSDGSTFTTSSLQGASGDPLTMTQVINNGDYTYTFEFSDGTSFTTDSLRGEVGPEGPPLTITNIDNNVDGTLTITFSDGTIHTTLVLKGDQGIQGDQGPVGPTGPQGDQGISVDHIAGTSTTEPGGTFSVAGETDTYTMYGDIAETIIIGTFSITNGTVISLEFTATYRDQILRIGDSTLPLTTTSQTLLEAINEVVSTKVETSSYTAADVLEKLLTVDGHTSGLDADTLDGKELSTIEADRNTALSLKVNTSDTIVAGRDIPVDGIKLDGIETNATRDQTATEILEAVKTVDGTGSGLDADAMQGIHGSKYIRLERSASGTPLTSGWMTVAQGGTGRFAGTVVVSDRDSGNQSFIEINFMQSYDDARFNVINVGGQQKRITGVRILRSNIDSTYSAQILQVYVTISSLYSVSISNNLSPDYLTLNTTTVDIQDTIADYAVVKEVTGLAGSSFATSDGAKINGPLFIQNNEAYHKGMDSGWLVPTLLNGYINGVEPISYRKSACGRVDIVGDYVHGGSLVNPSIFVLPVGFRSSKIVRVPTALDGFNKDGLIISTDGVVTPMFSGPGSTESVSCSFYADQ